MGADEVKLFAQEGAKVAIADLPWQRFERQCKRYLSPSQTENQVSTPHLAGRGNEEVKR